MSNRLLSRAVAASAIAALVCVSIPAYSSEAAPGTEPTIVESLFGWLSAWSPFPFFAKAGDDDGESGEEPETGEGDGESISLLPQGHESEEEPGSELHNDLEPGG